MDEWEPRENRALEVRTLRVFADERGTGGGLVAVVPDAAKLVPEPRERLAVAHRLGELYTVFVEDADTARVCLYTPVGEQPMAAHPLVGVVWLLARLCGGHPETVSVPGGDVASWQEDGRVWIRGPLAGMPPWWHEMLASPAEVDELVPRSRPRDLVQLWAWEDQSAGVVRARAFAPRLGVPEVEACGSASMRLATTLGRALTGRHGAGSVLSARPGPAGFADVGGFVVEDEVRFLDDLDWS